MAKLIRSALAVSVLGLAACASTATPDTGRPNVDMAEVREALGCPLDLAPVCVERTGKVTHCFCADRDALQRMLEPEKY